MLTERAAPSQFRESSAIHYNSPFAVNLVELHNTLKARLRSAARELFDVNLEQIPSEVPPRTALGDVAFPVAFELAKQIKKVTGEKRAPRTIAEALKPRLEQIDEVARIEVAGAGYLNVYFDRARMLTALAGAESKKELDGIALVGEAPQDRKLMVEHTSINPNKA